MLMKGMVPGWETEKINYRSGRILKEGWPHAYILVTLKRDHLITEKEIEKYCVEEIPEVLNKRN